MSNASVPPDKPVAAAFAALLRSRAVTILVVVFLALEVYNTAILPAITNTARAQIEIETARNIERLKRAEADKMEGEAKVVNTPAADISGLRAIEAKPKVPTAAADCDGLSVEGGQRVSCYIAAFEVKRKELIERRGIRCFDSNPVYRKMSFHDLVAMTDQQIAVENGKCHQ